MSKEETIALATQQIVEKAGLDISYMVGNATAKVVNYGEHFDTLTRGAAFIETSRAFGTNTFYAVQDVARNDKVCAGACLVASACEIIAGTSAMIKYPGSLRVYIVAKGISVGCIRFRNLCRNAQGDLTLC